MLRGISQENERWRRISVPKKVEKHPEMKAGDGGFADVTPWAPKNQQALTFLPYTRAWSIARWTSREHSFPTHLRTYGGGAAKRKLLQVYVGTVPTAVLLFGGKTCRTAGRPHSG